MTQTSPRRGYRNDIGFGWLLEQAIRCCRNLVHNWQESMDDSDVFVLFANSPHFGKKDLKDLVLNHFGPDAPFFEGEPGVPVPERPARNGKSKREPELPEGDDPLAKAVRHMQKRRMRLRACGGIFVGTTNCMDRLDPAVLRRFTFKLRFGYLDTAGKRLFFERMFKAPLDPESAARLDAIPSLAPGDYRTVRQSFHYLDDEPSAARLVDALERESDLKPPAIAAENRPFGFAPCGRSDE